MKFLAKLFSVLSHPLLMPTLLYTIILLLFPLTILPVEFAAKIYVLAFIFITTAVVPAVGILLLYLTGAIQDLSLEERSQRLLPNLFTCLIYVMVCFLLYDKLHFRGLLLNTMIGATLLVIILSSITAFWKISLHSAGIAGLVGFLFGINMVLPIDYVLENVLIALVFAGLVMSARLYLGAHKSSQIWAGTVLGAFIGVIIPLFFF